jgi:hypothetical protein
MSCITKVLGGWNMVYPFNKVAEVAVQMKFDDDAEELSEELPAGCIH